MTYQIRTKGYRHCNLKIVSEKLMKCFTEEEEAKMIPDELQYLNNSIHQPFLTSSTWIYPGSFQREAAHNNRDIVLKMTFNSQKGL